MFSCERCDKEFTEKRNLTRHQKTHLLSTEAYTCDACGKDLVTWYVDASSRVLVQVLLVSSSVVSAWPLVSRAGHDDVLGGKMPETDI
jgi:hypothetical protein